MGSRRAFPFGWAKRRAAATELSAAVSMLRAEVAKQLDQGIPAAMHWVQEAVGLDAIAAAQLIEYLAAGRAALQGLPTLDTVIFERFFDESGGMQLVIHSCFGSRVNRAWGLALRKRFCRTFNFELQAAATEDHIVLSLTESHSFELADAARYLHSNTVRQVLVQALCAAPMFEVRWRWVAGISLALPRFRGGKKVPPQIARMNAEDLLASVFPDQVACAENLPAKLKFPIIPWCSRPFATASRRPWMSMPSSTCSGAWRAAPSKSSRAI
jgi:ATP-dependent Lhr-like helicase